MTKGGTKRKLSHAAYDALIRSWNSTSRPYKNEAARTCSKEGHQWATAPFGTDVCQRCLKYDLETPIPTETPQ